LNLNFREVKTEHFQEGIFDGISDISLGSCGEHTSTIVYSKHLYELYTEK
jgi:hypothetical protein